MTEISLPINFCSCHYLDSTKFPILVWMRENKLLLKIANQHFIGFTRTDKKGERYWKCKNFTDQPTQEPVNNSQKEIKENEPSINANSTESNNSQ